MHIGSQLHGSGRRWPCVAPASPPASVSASASVSLSLSVYASISASASASISASTSAFVAVLLFPGASFKLMTVSPLGCRELST
jgi:hypothetical protein